MRPLPATMIAAALAAGACAAPKEASRADTATATDSTSGSTVGAPPASGAAVGATVGATPRTAPAVKSAGAGDARSVITKRPATSPATAPPMAMPGGPIRTSAAPGANQPARTTPALVIFRDSVVQADLDWLRGEGFVVANVDDASHAVSVSVPDGYSGNPTKNPRVRRFTIAMR